MGCGWVGGGGPRLVAYNVRELCDIIFNLNDSLMYESAVVHLNGPPRYTKPLPNSQFYQETGSGE